MIHYSFLYGYDYLFIITFHIIVIPVSDYRYEILFNFSALQMGSYYDEVHIVIHISLTIISNDFHHYFFRHDFRKM